MASEEYPASEDKKNCIACQEPIMINASICPHCRTSQSRSIIGHFGNVMKWIGGITAVLTLIMASVQLNRILEGTLERKESVEELVRASDLLAENSDYVGAFKLLDQALELSPASRPARERQVKIGMQYVRKYFLKPEKKKLELLDSVIPVLRRGGVHKDPEIAASAVSHLAWASYLKGSENYIVQNIFKNALTIDPDNVYAHSMLGSWCLQASTEECGKTSSERLKTAETHYFKALDLKKEMDYVTEIIFYSLYGPDAHHQKRLELSLEAIWYVNLLRTKDATLQEWIHRRCAYGYKEILAEIDDSIGAPGTYTDEYYLKKLVERVSIEDLIKTYEWLRFPQDKYPIEREYIRARLLEIAGQDDKAFAVYRKLYPKSDLYRKKHGSILWPSGSRFETHLHQALLRMLSYHRGKIGIEHYGMIDLQDDLQAKGVRINKLTPRGPAEKAGVKAEDVIVAINGEPIYSQDLFVRSIFKNQAGETIELLVSRDGAEIKCSVTLAESHRVISLYSVKDNVLWRAILNLFIYKAHEIYMGEGEVLQIVSITDEIRKDFELPAVEGVVVLSRHSGLDIVDVISHVDQQNIRNAEQFRKIIDLKRGQGKNDVLLSVSREDKQIQYKLKIM
ncbi:MAG: PDZ domain-containing protein [Desulfobacterales bacterium]|jgi:hypothetical protein